MVGLRRLGFDVAFVEQGAEISSAEREHFERVCAQFDIDGYLLTGPPPYELVARAEAATLLLDIGGHLTRPELKRGARVTEGVNTRLFRKVHGQWRITVNHVSAYDVAPTGPAAK